MRICINTLLGLLIMLGSANANESQYNGFGGWTERSFEAKGFFYVTQNQGIWWLVDPIGDAFLSKGVNHINYRGDHAPSLGYSPYHRVVSEKYESEQAWAQSAVERLRLWGFNTIGAWSSESVRNQRIPYTHLLDIGARAGANWRDGVFPDVFSDEFRRVARRVAREECRPRRNDTFLIGYFTDNELRWGPDWRGDDSLLIDFLGRVGDEAGHAAAIRFLEERYDSIEALNEAWRVEVDSFAALAEATPLPTSTARSRDEADFQGLTADRYFQVCREAILEADPNHLILGCRFAGDAPRPVLESAGRYCELISFNTYNLRTPTPALQHLYSVVRRPIMITEFSFKAEDSGLPNTHGAGEPVPTQKDRAERFTAFVEVLMELPYVVGYHWFQYFDQPRHGRFDGENSNFGLVTILDEPYPLLTQEMSRTNRRIDARHNNAWVWPPETGVEDAALQDHVTD